MCPSFEPKQVDEVLEYELTNKGTGSFEPLDVWFVLQQIELPDKMYKVIEHRDRNYRDLRMGRIHIALLPDNIRKAACGGLI